MSRNEPPVRHVRVTAAVHHEFGGKVLDPLVDLGVAGVDLAHLLGDASSISSNALTSLERAGTSCLELVLGELLLAAEQVQDRCRHPLAELMVLAARRSRSRATLTASFRFSRSRIQSSSAAANLPAAVPSSRSFASFAAAGLAAGGVEALRDLVHLHVRGHRFGIELDRVGVAERAHTRGAPSRRWCFAWSSHFFALSGCGRHSDCRRDSSPESAGASSCLCRTMPRKRVLVS